MSFDLSHFKFPFVKLSNGLHHLNFEVDGAFFEYFGNQDVSSASVTFTASVNKSDTMMVIDLIGQGTITSICDRCLNDLEISVAPVFKVIAHLNSSEEEVVTNDDINLQMIYLRSSDFELNLSSSIYESFLPCIPMVKSCETQSKKDCDQKMLNFINQNNVEENSIDPRWEKLKQLINKKDK